MILGPLALLFSEWEDEVLRGGQRQLNGKRIAPQASFLAGINAPYLEMTPRFFCCPQSVLWTLTIPSVRISCFLHTWRPLGTDSVHTKFH
jgi:hypothetical protein